MDRSEEIELEKKVRETIEGIKKDVAKTVTIKVASVIWEAVSLHYAKKRKELVEQETEFVKRMIELKDVLSQRCSSCGTKVKDKQELKQCPCCKSPICQKCLDKSEREVYANLKLKSVYGVKD